MKFADDKPPPPPATKHCHLRNLGFLASQPGNVRDADLGVAKLADGEVIEVCDAATLDALERRQAMVLFALVVEILLEVVVDDLAVRLREAALLLVVAVSEIVALAAGQEVEAFGLVGRIGAAVAGPDEPGGGFGRPVGLESIHGCVQQDIVGCGHACGVAGATKERKRERGWEEGEDGEEEKKRLHCGGVFFDVLTDWFKVLESAGFFDVLGQESLRFKGGLKGF